MTDSSGWILKKEILSTPANIHDPVMITLACQHPDGALLVAEYIIGEIRTNIQSESCKSIRYLLNYHQKRLKKWQQLPTYRQLLIAAPGPDLMSAMAIWTSQVFKGHPWDHKPLISHNSRLQAVAVHRKLWPLREVRAFRADPKNEGDIPTDSKSYWHKYKKHDYFYDIWSNIHYGYVGLACGFSQELLLKGASGAQFLDNLTTSGDTPDDRLGIEAGFQLYRQYGDLAAGLTPFKLMETLKQTPFVDSRDIHFCIHPNREELRNGS